MSDDKENKIVIASKDGYSIEFNSKNGVVSFFYESSSSFMDFYWWNTNIVKNVINRRIKKYSEWFIILPRNMKVKSIVSHNNIYLNDARDFVNLGIPKVLKYLEKNNYKRLNRKQITKSTLDKCEINYLKHLYSKI